MMSISPMHMDVGDDLILGWDWIVPGPVTQAGSDHGGGIMIRGT